MSRITLITPTRERPDDLKRFLKSIGETTGDPASIEILFYVDDDDKVTIPLIKPLEKEYADYNVHFHVGPRSDHFSKDYYNFLSKKAQGRWVIAINDDSIFVTPAWEEIICNKMDNEAKKFGDDILCGIVKDSLMRRGKQENRQPSMSCWLLSSKEYINFAGGLLIEEIYTWGGDYWFGRMWTEFQGGQRKIYIMDVTIEHNSHHANPSKPKSEHLPQPPSFKHFQRIENENPCTFTDTTIGQKVGALNNYLRDKK